MSYRSFYSVFFCFIFFNGFHLFHAQNSKSKIDDKTKSAEYLTYRNFVIFTGKKTWGDAVLHCEQNNMRIAEVKTIEEAQLLNQLMLKNRPNAIENAWIGGYVNLTKAGETHWKWLSNNEKITDDNKLWLKQLEMNSKTDDELKSSKSLCLLLDRHLSTPTNPVYIQATCDRARQFICQKLNDSMTLISKSTTPVVNYESVISSPNILTHSSIDVTVTLTTPITSSHNIFSTLPAPTKISYVDVTPTIAMPTTQFSSRIKTNKSEKVRVPTTCSPIETTTGEEYSDYKMWELGRKQMRMRKKIYSTKNQRKISNVPRRKIKYLKKPQNRGSMKIFSTTNKPEIKKQSTIKPLKPLRLYYAFEGPMIGGLVATPLSQIRFDDGTKVMPIPHYQKYISRRKYNQLLANKQTHKYY